MPKLLITGGSGFIGTHLSQRLEVDGFEVVGLSGDLLDYDQVRKQLLAVGPNYVVHLAARTEVEKSFYEPISFSSTNYVGTVNLIEICRDLDQLELFVFASTMETYGWQPVSDEVRDSGTVREHVVFDEQTPQHPNAPYAVAKVGCEKYLEYAGRAYGLPWVALRQTNSYGRRDNEFFVVEQIITQMLRQAVCSLGDPLPYRNFLFIEDLLELYVAVLRNPAAVRQEVLCTGPPNAIQIRALAEMISGMTQFTGELQWGTKPARVGEIFYLNSTHKKASELIGWQPRVSLEEGLVRTIDMWR